MNAPSEKRILIVDDEPKVAIVLASSLRKMGPHFNVETAGSGQEALKKIEQIHYDLMLTDYKMPSMTGLELSAQVRNHAPGTQIVLMTAYGTVELRRKLAELGVHGYIEKPFKVAQLRKIVIETIGQDEPEEAPTPPQPQSKSKPKAETDPVIDPNHSKSGIAALQQTLQKLLRNAHASCIMLLNASGYPVETVGRTEGFDVSSLGALAAANCSVFKSNYHESDKFNLYSYDINGDLFLAVIFGINTKPGIVWYYTKQTAEELVPLAQHYANFKGTSTFEIQDDFRESFLHELDTLMDSSFTDPEITLPKSVPDKPATSPSPTPPVSPPAKKKRVAGSMSYEDAVKAGLVPPNILKREG
ncbi:MAG: response regulator [Anaerolineae bacterium]|nr:response regulator [Anaerolineae bacterium]